MNVLVILAFAFSTVGIQARSINTSRTTIPLLDIFSSKNVSKNNTTTLVRVSTHNKHGDISKSKNTFEMTNAAYALARTQASAVFMMKPNNFAVESTPERTSWAGTAFHIGENLVLTNHHVLSPDRSNLNECGGFELHSNTESKIYPCKKVHYCNKADDFCLIEMGPSLGSKKKQVQFKLNPKLMIKENPQMDLERMNDMVMTCIGNTMGLGIHYSQGKGLQGSNDVFYFWAPLRTGNSGGPLIGEDGTAWGVVKLESNDKVGTDSNNVYNVALSMERVISLVQLHVKDEVTLANFNKAIAK